MCSKHLKIEDFLPCYTNLQDEGYLTNEWLGGDEIGISVFPTIYPPSALVLEFVTVSTTTSFSYLTVHTASATGSSAHIALSSWTDESASLCVDASSDESSTSLLSSNLHLYYPNGQDDSDAAELEDICEKSDDC